MASPRSDAGVGLGGDRALGVPADSRRARMGQATRQRALDGANFFAETISLATPLFNTTGCVES